MAKTNDSQPIRSQDSRIGDIVDEDVKLAGDVNCPVLITGGRRGERETIARLIHQEGQFVRIDCTQMSESSFAGALACARSGTLFLADIGEMSPPMQARLFRFVEEQGSQCPTAGDRGESRVRIISATGRPLADRIGTEQFSADLFYRLNLIHIKLP